MMVVRDQYHLSLEKISDKKINEIKSIDGVKDAWGDVIGFAQFIKLGPRRDCHTYTQNVKEKLF